MKSIHTLGAVGVLVAACSSGPHDDASSLRVGGSLRNSPHSVLEGSFSLDNGGLLTLADSFAAPVARIQDRFGDRLYGLIEKRPECGSRHYTGASDGIAVRIVDHRARTCKDRVQAKLIVIEALSDGTQRKLLSRRRY